jgi:uncharacterized protein YhfF
MQQFSTKRYQFGEKNVNFSFVEIYIYRVQHSKLKKIPERYAFEVGLGNHELSQFLSKSRDFFGGYCKGTVSRDFRPSVFFHQNIRPGKIHF